jgi:hypothetical protein
MYHQLSQHNRRMTMRCPLTLFSPSPLETDKTYKTDYASLATNQLRLIVG